MFFQKIKSINTKELEQLLKTEKVSVIDVREKEEYQSGHIQHALNMPLSNIDHFTLQKPAYVICQSGMRSRNATKIFTKKGYDVTNVSGGMSAWKGKVVR